MNDIGHLYVLANSAMPGLVKIGKTTRSPAERAFELSSATGLPTPFIVVYEQLFGDCSAAESFVHTYLGVKGFRVSDNREFFSATVNDVVRAIALAPGAIDSDTVASSIEGGIDPMKPRETGELDDLQLGGQSSVRLGLWESIFEDAESHYFGLGDELQDYKAAMNLYLQAAKLGSLPAYSRIGEMYQNGLGVQADQDKALTYFKEGARKGSLYCYWAMGMLFWSPLFSDEKLNISNAEKCFSLFVQRLYDVTLPFVVGQHLTSRERDQVMVDCVRLLQEVQKNFNEPPLALTPFIFNVVDDIERKTKTVIDFYRKQTDSFILDNLERVLLTLQVIAVAKKNGATGISSFFCISFTR